MNKVVLDMALSLDGFICGRDGEDAGLHEYYFAPAGETAKVVEEGIQTTGVIVMGRGAYDLAAKQDGFVDDPYQVPTFILTHTAPAQKAKGAEKFVFVTDGIDSLLSQARSVVAADKNIVIGGGAAIARSFLNAGLIDEIQLHLVTILLGEGKRLFDHLNVIGSEAIQLEKTRVVNGPQVIHLQFRVVK